MMLNFYTSSLESMKTDRLDYPQAPLQQTWRIDYPLLAYKCMDPDNRQIALVHLGRNIPQRIIDLGSWEFVSFI